MCNPTLRGDINATAAHLKDMVYWSPEIHTPPGRQLSAMGNGRGRGCGTGRGGRDSRAGRDGRGGCGCDSGRGHGARVNDRGRRSDFIPSTTTSRPKNCPKQDAVDCAKPSIVNRYVTGNRIFVGDHVYNTEMNTTERHAVFHIRAVLMLTRTLWVEQPGSTHLRWRLCSVLCRRSVEFISLLYM